MQNRSTGILITVLAVLLCGCPGLTSLCWGSILAIAGISPGSTGGGPQEDLAAGIALLCLGLVFVAIPVVVGFLTLRSRAYKPNPAYANEEIPPAI